MPTETELKSLREENAELRRSLAYLRRILFCISYPLEHGVVPYTSPRDAAGWRSNVLQISGIAHVARHSMGWQRTADLDDRLKLARLLILAKEHPRAHPWAVEYVENLAAEKLTSGPLTEPEHDLRELQRITADVLSRSDANATDIRETLARFGVKRLAQLKRGDYDSFYLALYDAAYLRAQARIASVLADAEEVETAYDA